MLCEVEVDFHIFSTQSVALSELNFCRFCVCVHSSSSSTDVVERERELYIVVSAAYIDVSCCVDYTQRREGSFGFEFPHFCSVLDMNFFAVEEMEMMEISMMESTTVVVEFLSFFHDLH